MFSLTKFGAVTGSALTVLALIGFCWRPALSSNLSAPKAETLPEAPYSRAYTMWGKGRYTEAGELAIAAAKQAEEKHYSAAAAKAWSLAGSCSLVDLHLKDALNRYFRGMEQAKSLPDKSLQVSLCSNITSVFLQMGDAGAALQYSKKGLRAADSVTPSAYVSTLQLQTAKALTQLQRYPEAFVEFRSALSALEDSGDPHTLAIGWQLFGASAMDSGDLNLAETALSHSLYIARTRNVADFSGILSKLARLKERQGDAALALSLHNAAVSAPADIMPPWLAYADRGSFHLARKEYEIALSDFETARNLLQVMREEVLPSDQGRVNLENGLSRVADGLIEAGNHLASNTNSTNFVALTFDAAEHHRSLTVSALTPEPADWRSRLPATYWDILSQFRSLQRSAYFGDSRALREKSDALQLQLSQMEAAADSDRRAKAASALTNVRNHLSPDELFLSFHVGPHESWLWTVEKGVVSISHLPSAATLSRLSAAFKRDVQTSGAFENSGRELYDALFGSLPTRLLDAKRWILEPDGPLFDVPFAALPVPGSKDFLCERTALQISPGAMLLRKGRSLAGASFLGVGDPIYNAADSRYRGENRKPSLALPRLPGSNREIIAASRLWANSTVLTGSDANAPRLFNALQKSPDILHFATHIISTPGEYRSGLIALSLDRKGDIDLLGPTEIIARKLEVELVVMNGCQSAQAQTVPGSGLMGLTRAWIASGANSVLATRWDVADGDSQNLLTLFYSALREHPAESPAFGLQRARAKLLQNPETRKRPSTWAAYFLLSRT